MDHKTTKYVKILLLTFIQTIKKISNLCSFRKFLSMSDRNVHKKTNKKTP